MYYVRPSISSLIPCLGRRVFMCRVIFRKLVKGLTILKFYIYFSIFHLFMFYLCDCREIHITIIFMALFTSFYFPFPFVPLQRRGCFPQTLPHFSISCHLSIVYYKHIHCRF
jgi:hypothetical protein